MNFNYTSAHARVFDGVRTARYRAFTDARADVHESTCVFDTEPAAALWVHPDTGNISALCHDHLRASMERVYTDGEDPPVVVPLKRRDSA